MNMIWLVTFTDGAWAQVSTGSNLAEARAQIAAQYDNVAKLEIMGFIA